MLAFANLVEPLSKRQLVGSTTVISATGCFFRASDTVTPGTVVRLQIERDGKTFETWAQVAHVRPDEGMGLAFFDTAQTQRILLKHWIAELARPAAKQ
jgi:hypothetical protein